MEDNSEKIKLKIKKYLSLENVSFLFGAGTSFHLGAPIIRGIPSELKEICKKEIDRYFPETVKPSYEEFLIVYRRIYICTHKKKFVLVISERV